MRALYNKALEFIISIVFLGIMGVNPYEEQKKQTQLLNKYLIVFSL